jgi:predicted transcriptional regulator
MADVRTTIDLPPDLHELTRHLAHESGRSMSDVVAELIRLGLRQSRPEVHRSARGVPTVSVGRSVTPEDVRSLDDEA